MDRTAVAKGFAWTAAFSLVAKIVFPLAGIVLVARKLGPEVTGIIGLMQQTIAIADVIRDAGLTQSYLAEGNLSREKEASYGGLSLIMGIIPTVLMLALTVPMANFFGRPELLYGIPFTALCMLMSTIGTIPNARFLRKGELRRQGLMSVIANGIALTVTIVMVRMGVGFPALVTQMVLGGALYLAFLLRVEPLPGFRVGRGAMIDVFRRSRALFGASLLNNLFLMSDIFVIQRMVGSKAAGLYNSAQNVGYKPADLISFPLSRTLMVAFSQATGDIPKLSRAYYRSLAAIVLLVIPIYVFLGLGSDTILRTLYGEKFLGSIPVLSALCVYLGIRTLGNVSGNALVPAGRHTWTLYPWILALVVTGSGLAWVSRAPTLMGIVWAYVAGSVVVYGAILGLAIYFVPGDREQYGRVLRALGVTSVTSLVLFGCFQLPLPHDGRFAVAGALGLLVHSALVGWLSGVGPVGLFSMRGVREAWERI